MSTILVKAKLPTKSTETIILNDKSTVLMRSLEIGLLTNKVHEYW